MSEKHKDKDHLTTSQAARLLSVSSDTVLKWVKAGKVKSYRTLGGHFRIPASELKLFSMEKTQEVAQQEPSSKVLTHQYCWEYLAAGGEVKSECMDCITYRSRAKRCYQLKDLPGGLGCLNIMCDTECKDCEYYRVVSEQAMNILIIGEGSKLLEDIDELDDSEEMRVQAAENEYNTALIIQDFRPDYIIVDCDLGKKRTASICNSLFNDIRIPVTRIILSSQSQNIRDYCDREVFSWIKKPFSFNQLKDCIMGVPKMKGTTL